MHPKLERAMPLLEHWCAGGDFIYNNQRIANCNMSLIGMMNHPERYTIHREPRELFVNHYPNARMYAHTTPERAKTHLNNDLEHTTVRYVEDLTWKPS